MQTLNLDVFALVLEHLSTQETLPFATVCKAIHAIVIREVLSSVIPRSSSQLAAFIEFMLAAPSERIPLLRQLTVSLDAFLAQQDKCRLNIILAGRDEELLPLLRTFAVLLTQILTQTDKLQSLSLAACAYFFRRHPELRAALIEYKHMEKLLLFDLDSQGLQLIKDMKSSLRSISIDCYQSEFRSYILYMAAHPELEDVSLPGISKEEFEVNDETQVQWPLVKSLKVHGDQISPASLVTVFPNIRFLRLSEYMCTWDDDRVEPLSQNQWPILDYLESSCGIIRDWALRPNVRWLEVDDIFYHAKYNPYHRWEGDAQLVRALNQTRPAILTLYCGHNARPEFWKMLADEAPQLQLLHLTIFPKEFELLHQDWIVRVSSGLLNFSAS